ncbi:RDD family protein [Mangrovivirga sp. M17]|uniref:RDD family protein n=1 Tax=Mangrovivirga halotolerans TaxID=2993936 RepID=A0ABT3RN79_9BACT|nr:RDD family protein [Mangrovivirga halotolerans]MCX2743261.1 RDD family protein [Mangrovivirga halotolerans]
MKSNKLPIVPIALFIGIIGLATSLYSYFFSVPLEERTVLTQMIYWFSPYVDVWLPNTSIFTIFNDSGMGYLNLAAILFWILILTGALIYQNSNGTKSNLLRLCFSIILITAGMGVVHMPLVIIFGLIFDSDSEVGWSWIPFFIRNILFVVIAFKAIKQLNELNDNKVISHSQKGSVSKGTRFLNYLMDIVIISFYGAPAVSNLFPSSHFFDYYYESMELIFQISLYVALILYYLFFESVFKRTPGKMITGSKVIAEKGSLTFGKVLGRTFSRFVPFEPLSFFGDKGWHDKWTDTQVVKEGSKATEEHKISYEELGLVDA